MGETKKIGLLIEHIRHALHARAFCMCGTEGRKIDAIFGGPIYTYNECRNKKILEGRLQKKLDVFDHQIDQKLATDVIGVSFDVQ